MPNKLTVQFPGSDQVVTLDMSLSNSTILQSATEVDTKQGLVSTVNDGTLSQLLTMASAQEVTSSELLREAETPQLSDGMVATAGTDLITEPTKQCKYLNNNPFPMGSTN